ncbi:MAG: hypothetical protein HY854_05680 [Burkholderiales bacterium]|nr:hypothetical protein [Burkholderiales bacterium]
MNWQHRLLAFPLLALAACAGLQEPHAYVGGNFTLRRPALVTAFVLTNQQSGEEYLLPFTKRRQFEAGHNETTMVRVPPGNYRLTHWIVFDAKRGPNGKAGDFRAEMTPGPASEPFTLRGNELLFLGKFTADNESVRGYISSTTSGSWTIERTSPDRVKRDLMPGS